MITDKKSVRMFVVENLGYIIGQVVLKDGIILQGLTIKYPFKLIPQQDGQLSVAPIFIKEEFATFNFDKVICELPVDDKMMEIYERYSQKVHSSIIVPDNSTGLNIIR